MTKIRQFQIRTGTTVLEGRAASQGAGLPGGQKQIYVNNPAKDLLK